MVIVGGFAGTSLSVPGRSPTMSRRPARFSKVYDDIVAARACCSIAGERLMRQMRAYERRAGYGSDRKRAHLGVAYSNLNASERSTSIRTCPSVFDYVSWEMVAS
jgi:hypothetical protein